MSMIDYIREQYAREHKLIHAANIIKKYEDPRKNSTQQNALDLIIPQYYEYLRCNNTLRGWDRTDILRRVDYVNQYYNFIRDQGFDNVFSAQGKFRPSILEEFIYLLFRDYINYLREKYNVGSDKIDCGQFKAYTNLFFKAKDFQEFVVAPKIGINVKDQDFAIYSEFELSIRGDREESIMVPVIAVEAKTFIDKTMLDSIIATAEKLKNGNPYTRFIAIAEHYDVGKEVDPAYSRIDQIYILRKGRRRDEWRDIDANVVYRMFEDAKIHIERPWSDIEARLFNEGVIL